MIILIMNNTTAKKITTAATLGLLALTNVASVAAVDITPKQPAQGIALTTEPGTIFSNVISIIFVIAIVLVLFFLVMGAFNWITSGGDKEKIKSARGTILHALIGLAILALSFVIMNVASQILNVQFSALTLPKLSD